MRDQVAGGAKKNREGSTAPRLDTVASAVDEHPSAAKNFERATREIMPPPPDADSAATASALLTDLAAMCDAIFTITHDSRCKSAAALLRGGRAGRPTSVEELAACADEIWTRTRNPRCKVAAGILRGKRGGKPAIDDTSALEEIDLLVSTGKADSIEKAARFVAEEYARRAAHQSSVHSIESATRRLARKYRAQN
jgi:hypothetical protein